MFLTFCRSRERRERDRGKDTDRDKIRSSERDRHRGREKEKETYRAKDRKRHSRSRSADRSRKRAAPDSDKKLASQSKDKHNDKGSSKAEKSSAKPEIPKADMAPGSAAINSTAASRAADAEAPTAPNGAADGEDVSMSAVDRETSEAAAPQEDSGPPEPALANGHADSEHKPVSKGELGLAKRAPSSSRSASPTRSTSPAPRRKDSLSRWELCQVPCCMPTCNSPEYFGWQGWVCYMLWLY